MDRVDVVVIGGGAMGSAATWQLARRGVDVALLERFEPGHAMGSSHGSSRIVRLTYDDPFYVGLAVAAYEMWDELEDESGEQLLTWTGVVDHGEQAMLDALAATLRRGSHATETVDAREAGRRWPGLRFEGPVLFHQRGGQVHADRAVAALQRAAVRHGAEIRHGVRVEAVSADGADRIRITAAGQAWLARRVVVAAGAWTTSVVGDLVTLPTLTVTREQPVHFPPSDPSVPWPSFIHHLPGAAARGGATPRGAYGLPSPDGVKVGFHAVGPVVDPDLDRREVDGGQLRKLQQYVRRWVPGVDMDRPRATPCLYTLTESSDFVIDRIGAVTVATGFSGHGFKFTPEIGRIVADVATGAAAPPARFRLGAHG